MKDDLTFEEARQRIAAAMRPPTDTESVPLEQARGRVLAADVISPIDVPAHDNSAMDGYALHGNDLSADARTVLQAVETTALAGAPVEIRIARGQCLRIMTGAVMPANLDTVVPIESCAVLGQAVTIAAGTTRVGNNRRRRGEDLAHGHVALAAGRRLRPADLGLLASLGIERVSVFRRLRVALLSTGDEVCAPGQPLAPGQIYDSNRFGLMGGLQALGVDVIDLGRVADDAASVRTVLDRASDVADVVITSGGVGMGDADQTGTLLRERGYLLFSHVAIRPGRPVTFGQLPRAAGHPVWLFALPGNPVAALVTFHVLARDALLALSGAQASRSPRLRARAAAVIRKRAGRTEFQRGVVSQGVDGGLDVRLTASQGSGILSSLSEANALIVLPDERETVQTGDSVEVWMLDEMI